MIMTLSSSCKGIDPVPGMCRILASGIRNPGTSGVHLKESAIRLTIKTGIQVLLTNYRRNPVPEIWIPWHGIQNPRLSWIPLHGATLSYVLHFSCSR